MLLEGGGDGGADTSLKVIHGRRWLAGKHRSRSTQTGSRNESTPPTEDTRAGCVCVCVVGTLSNVGNCRDNMSVCTRDAVQSRRTSIPGCRVFAQSCSTSVHPHTRSHTHTRTCRQINYCCTLDLICFCFLNHPFYKYYWEDWVIWGKNDF